MSCKSSKRAQKTTWYCTEVASCTSEMMKDQENVKNALKHIISFATILKDDVFIFLKLFSMFSFQDIPCKAFILFHIDKFISTRTYFCVIYFCVTVTESKFQNV